MKRSEVEGSDYSDTSAGEAKDTEDIKCLIHVTLFTKERKNNEIVNSLQPRRTF